ncbi:MAG: type II secretion system protein GspG, partial [bacterium]
LLIVMMILAILVSLVIGLGRYADTIGKRHHALADLGKWQEAVHRYHERLDQYPSNSVYTADVTNLLLASVQIGGAGANAMFVRFGELMPSLPPAVDPWGSAYQYVAATNQAPQSFDLYSFGPDRLGGTSDDVRFQP